MVPDEGVLKKAYIGAYKAAKNREEVNKIVSQFDEDVHIPGDLKSKIKKSISGTTRLWDGAIKTARSKCLMFKKMEERL